MAARSAVVLLPERPCTSRLERCFCWLWLCMLGAQPGAFSGLRCTPARAIATTSLLATASRRRFSAEDTSCGSSMVCDKQQACY